MKVSTLLHTQQVLPLKKTKSQVPLLTSQISGIKVHMYSQQWTRTQIKDRWNPWIRPGPHHRLQVSGRDPCSHMSLPSSPLPCNTPDLPTTVSFTTVKRQNEHYWRAVIIQEILKRVCVYAGAWNGKQLGLASGCLCSNPISSSYLLCDPGRRTFCAYFLIYRKPKSD